MTSKNLGFATSFALDNALNDDATEFNIWFDEESNDFDRLIDFAQKYDDRQVNLTFRNGVDVRKAASLHKLCPNVRVVLDMKDVSRAKELVASQTPFYFSHDFPCRSLTELSYFVETLGASEVYIADDLCYNLDGVRKYCDTYGIKLRVRLNRCQTSMPVTDKRVVFYRPQDMEWLGAYYDVGEFDLGEDKGYDFAASAVLYRRYYVERDWYDDLRIIIPDLPFPVMNRSLPRALGEYRATCDMRCVGRGANCSHCAQMISLMNALAGKNIQLDSTKPIRRHAGEETDAAKAEDT